MNCNIFTAGKATLLAFIAAQFASTVLGSPLAGLELKHLVERQSCSYPLTLGTAGAYALLAKGGITNTATPLSITGNIGVTPSGSVVNITPPQVTGTININNAAASSAAAVAANTCRCAASKTPSVLIATELGGVTFAPGTYRTSSTANVAASTIVTLDGASNANGQWIFQFPGSLTTGANVQIKLINGAKACNVYWVVGSALVNAATTLGANTIFYGNICDYGSITSGIGVKATGGWFTLPATPIITIAGGTFSALPTCPKT
ncbi:MAG: hypothetical protein Q9217_006008 [Psora testacea]